MSKLIKRRERTDPPSPHTPYGCEECGPIDSEEFIADDGEIGSLEYHAVAGCQGQSYFTISAEEFENLQKVTEQALNNYSI